MSYLTKRVLRIIPGYLVSFWICVLLIAPFVGGDISFHSVMDQLLLTLRLLQPDVPGALHDLPYDSLNGSMWTIAYEFRCYLVAALIGVVGAYKPQYRIIFLAAVAISLLLNATGTLHHVQEFHSGLIGTPEKSLRFFAIFGTGALFYVFRDKVKLYEYGRIHCCGTAYCLII